MEGLNAYISEEGYLIIPEYDIKYLINFSESNIPSMPEATESTVRIAGRDGDITLKTTYEPIPFEIVCYTEDNLSPTEKVKEEEKISNFLNSIKNETISFGMETYKKFYNVKYSGSLITTRFPKHLKFSIPLKSSESYGMYYLKRQENGNAEFESDTIKEVGAVFTIEGPATNPQIALNNYQMRYDGTVLEGNKLVIDSTNSTITLITYAGIESNAMRYYNHQFPKIQKGINQLQVQNGVEEENVSIEWYDLKL